MMRSRCKRSRRHRFGVARVAFEYFHRHRTALGGGQDAENYLRVAAPLIARVTVLGQRTVMAFKIGRSQIVQHQGALSQVSSRQRGFNRGWPRDQPVHSRVEVVFVEGAQLQLRAERVMAGLRTQGAAGGELRRRFEDARGNQGQGLIALAAGFGIEHGVELQAADRGQHRRDMTVWERAGDGKRGGQIRNALVIALEQLAQGLDLQGRPLGEIGDGAVVDLAIFAEAFSQEDGGWGVAVGDGRHIHVDRIRYRKLNCKCNIHIYMTTK
jgi:hypothetical protein